MEPIEVRRKVTHKAVQLTKENIDEVAEWIKAEPEDIDPCAVVLEVIVGGGDIEQAHAGCWIVYDTESEEFWVFDDEEFHKEYLQET